ncbi:Fatty acyl-CoA reductase [Peribacillus sp. Bi96]|uniref:SDR family NAD(P)-dependent oxidoreductase n=1 Tax=Peribacillus sp. Bi96 TaxID=2884273 RepID=UPI001D84844D|nr:SDR family NAD(P)-dependent oxidoreductase [Peribacillus sp. Bi96]CAH0261220.1 Fatty acyl-CoA reductase [Peribacillus sp. Bi96]
MGDGLEVNQLFNLSGKVAIITGASKGIGKDLAKLLAQAGANIALVARNKAQLEEAAHEIEQTGVNVLPVHEKLIHYSFWKHQVISNTKSKKWTLPHNISLKAFNKLQELQKYNCTEVKNHLES